jgi:putative transposase
VVSLPQQRQAVDVLVNIFEVSQRRACKVLDFNRASTRYKAKRNNVEIKKLIIELSYKYPRYGYRKIFHLLKAMEIKINKETIRSVRKQEGLQVLKKQRKKRAFPSKTKLRKAEYPNHVWSYDFMFDATVNGRKLKILNIIDEYSRVCLLSVCARTITASDLYRELQKLFILHGKPDYIRSDNGTEFTANFIKDKLKENNINTIYINPGSPWQNAFVESFNSVVRDYVLNPNLFFSPKEAQVYLDNFKQEYNWVRPHGSLDGVSPMNFINKISSKKLCA